ncbi:sensor histidine kinase [Streptomyces sp. NPDC058001]|uniref:sensor histidine kinase n=1 Tax=Streptomyces sp. NPDC058001 TaxID=3346300 RepID=UPI0036EA950B
MTRARAPRTRSPRARSPRTRSLRTRLVVGSVALIAVVCAVIGTVTTIALHSHLYEQLDATLDPVAARAVNPPPKRDARADNPLYFVESGPQELGTLGAVVGSDGTVAEGMVSNETQGTGGALELTPDALTPAQGTALNGVPKDGDKHNVDLPGLGEYRVTYAWGKNGAFYVGIPTAKVTNTLNTLVVVEISVTAAGLAAASLAGAAMVGVALRPLRRVAATATRVSELPLHSGEVALHERVPDTEADPRTEVGQVGAALNRMLDHVHAALDSRQHSETRVRQFVADASHELRTPLASIRGYAELTRRGREPTGPDTRHALGRIESEANRMTGLVEDLLLLARLDAGRPLEYACADLSPLVVDALSDARAADQDHAWRLDLPSQPQLVLADAARVQQVLVNLLANARTHTPPGTTVTARVHRHGRWVCLDVSDDGPGIPPALLPHVFERFARGDSSRSRVSGSTGLGLAIVQAVTAAHGGGVTVESVPGRTVFTVHLPAYDGGASWPVTATHTGPVAATHSGPGTTVHTMPGTGVHTAVTHSQAGHSPTTQP